MQNIIEFQNLKAKKENSLQMLLLKNQNISEFQTLC